MKALPSINEVISAMPSPVVLLNQNGGVIAVSRAYIRLLNAPPNADFLSQAQLQAAYSQILADTAAGNRQSALTVGSWTLQYTVVAASECVLICFTCGQNIPALELPPHSVVSPSSNPRELPGPEQTLDLLGKAIAASQAPDASLALARLHVCVQATNEPLRTADGELWRNIGRKLRGACRMSDLVGITADGDFLIILLGANIQDAQTVICRVLGQVEAWLRQSAPLAVEISAGYTCWQSADGNITPEVLVERTRR